MLLRFEFSELFDELDDKLFEVINMLNDKNIDLWDIVEKYAEVYSRVINISKEFVSKTFPHAGLYTYEGTAVVHNRFNRWTFERTSVTCFEPLDTTDSIFNPAVVNVAKMVEAHFPSMMHHLVLVMLSELHDCLYKNYTIWSRESFYATRYETVLHARISGVFKQDRELVRSFRQAFRLVEDNNFGDMDTFTMLCISQLGSVESLYVTSPKDVVQSSMAAMSS